MPKKKLPKALVIRNLCRKEAGVEPFKPETSAQKREIESCMIRRTKTK
jgi:hypothetical protein